MANCQTMTTFQVDDVCINKTLYLEARNWGEIVAARSRSKGILPEAFSKPSDPEIRLLDGGWMNGFVQSVHIAYAEHYPLVISPDDIWMCIVQGFAAHINANAEKLRHLFVEHEGKKIIRVRRDDFLKGSSENPWPEAFSEFSVQIRSHIGDKTHDLLTPGFTTTGPVEKAAAEIVLMNAFKEYFDYRCATSCGIPEITLTGTVNDWKQLRERTLGLAQFELEWWIDAVKPVLDQFVAAAEGCVDEEFWSTIYKQTNGSGGPYISGWIITLFPYLDSQQKQRNRWLTKWNFNRITTGSLPPGVANTPFVWEYFGEEIQMSFNAGFMGACQNTTTLAVSPVIGWSVVDEEKLAAHQKKKEEELKRKYGTWK